MVKVGVREDDRVDVFGGHGQRLPIAQAQLLVALKQAAVDQQALVLVFDQVFGAGHGVGSAEEGDGGAHAPMVGVLPLQCLICIKKKGPRWRARSSKSAFTHQRSL